MVMLLMKIGKSGRQTVEQQLCLCLKVRLAKQLDMLCVVREIKEDIWFLVRTKKLLRELSQRLQMYLKYHLGQRK